MINFSQINQKALIKYPLFWEYKVIFKDNIIAKDIFKQILNNKDYSFEANNKSKNGKYQSYKLKIYIINEKERLEIFDKLKSISSFVI